MMDCDNITQTGAKASGVEEITPRMAVHHRAHRSETERNVSGGHGVHEAMSYKMPLVVQFMNAIRNSSQAG